MRRGREGRGERRRREDVVRIPSQEIELRERGEEREKKGGEKRREKRIAFFIFR